MIFFKLCYFLNGINAHPTSGSPPVRRQYITKQLFFLVLLLVFGLKVSARPNPQRIDLNLTAVPLITAFDEIKKQTGYGFWYEKADLEGTKKVTLKIKSASLRETLDKCFLDQPLSYEIFDKTIVVKKKVKPKLQGNYDTNKKDIEIRGKVLDENSEPLHGAAIRIKGLEKVVLSNPRGEFSIEVPSDTSILVISNIGYQTQEISVKNNTRPTINLRTLTSQLEEVTINTGFDYIPKERATGSFVQIDNELLNRNGASTNILQRIDGISSGVVFNNRAFDNNGGKQARQSEIEVRGRATLFSPSEPLIVLDNFPYDGDPGTINPNDIESVTILKDAAAASAWGARSGNGVIVITTKKGKLNSAPMVSFNSSVTIAAKPDIFSQRQLSSPEFVEVQQFLFEKGAYNTTINNGYSALPPAVEIMLARRNGTINPEQEASQLNQLAGYDVRQQMLQYNYRQAVAQQYQASISGGTQAQKYFVSAGYDSNLNGTVNNSYDRLTLNASNTYYFLKNKLELFSNIIYTSSKTKNGPSLTALYPYSQFADSQENPLPEARDLRISYATQAGNGKLLNWLYKPLEEVNNGYSATTNDLTSYRLNLSLGYTIANGLKASAIYGYEKSIADGYTLHEPESYFARNQINRLSSINPTSGAVSYPMPKGAILNTNLGNLNSHNARFQLNFNKTWAKHTISSLGGSEVKDLNNFRSATSWYGYDPETAINQNSSLSYITDFPLFYNPSLTSRINPNASRNGTTNRYLSYYFNGSYSYDGKYIVSASARRDESNLFGVSANQKGVPLWSAGVAWNLDQESFYKLNWLPSLKIRATYGYTGNVNNSVSAYLTATNVVSNDYNTNYSNIANPPNPNLRWEKIRNINIGADFATIGNWIHGTLDLWQKKGIDLIGNSPIAPQTGIALYTGNSANTLTKGIDLILNSNNLQGSIKWQTTLIYNYTVSKVTEYKVSNGTNINVVSANYNNPLKGYPFYALFSFRYAGLDAAGAPQGYLSTGISTDYNSIMNSTDRSQLKYHGSAVPTSFGSLRNSFFYGSFDLSFNILYKFGYFFRRNSLNNSSLYSIGGAYLFPDYENRWQSEGDEHITNVPAQVYPAVTNRTNIYTYSEALVEKGDHIRLQDLRIGYSVRSKTKQPFKNLNLFSYVSNMGIIWRANKKNIDPDSPIGIRNPISIAFGFKMDL